MKKFFLTFLFAFSLIFAKAQTLTSFVQAGVGLDTESSGYQIFAEYGRTWKWLDVSLTLDYESTFPLRDVFMGQVSYYWENGSSSTSNTGNYSGFSQTAFMLNVRIDIIRFFVENSRHALKIGGGGGYANYQSVWSSTFYSGSTLVYSLATSTKHYWTGAIRASYEFDVTKKLTLGAFFFGSYIPCAGLSIRRNF